MKMPNISAMPVVENHAESTISAATSSIPEASVAGPVDEDSSPSHLVPPKIDSVESRNASNIMAPKIHKDGIEVVALRKGFYNQTRYNEGETFTGPKKVEELGEWTKCLDPDIEKQRVEFLKQKKAKK